MLIDSTQVDSLSQTPRFLLGAYYDSMRGHRQLIFIPLAALLALLPLIAKGLSCGHDLEFHLRSWLEVSSQWRQGILFPHWDFTAAWNSGEPRFVFYPPLSWSLGALLGLILPWSVVPTVFIWLALIGCGLTMFRLACEWATPNNALIATTFYMVNPYMLFTFYERAALAELLAAAWIPLLLLAILRPRLTLAGIAIPVCLLWLTNAPAAVMGTYAFGVLGTIRIISTYHSSGRSRAALGDAAKIAAGGILGIGLAGFYILPATIEQHWVQINMPFVRAFRYQDNFFFDRIGDSSHDGILRTASFCGLALLVVAGLFGALALNSSGQRRKMSPDQNGEKRRIIIALAVLSCFAAFLLTSSSTALWRELPELRFLQFPWRFCAILGATAAALIALAVGRAALRPAFALTIAAALTLSFTLCGNYFLRQPCYGAASISNQVESFYQGGQYDPTDEYTPVDADALALQHSNPASWIAANPSDTAPVAKAGDYSIDLARRLQFDVSSTAPKFFVISLRDYPAWRIAVNGVPVVIRPHRADGLIVVPIASGNSRIFITYARTPDQIAGWIITALSAALLLLILCKRKQSL